MNVEEALERAYKENLALQEILAHVLDTSGGTAYITRADLTGGKFVGKKIEIFDDLEADRFVVRLVDDVVDDE